MTMELWDILDVWLFRQDVELHDVVLNPCETCDAMWASRDVIHEMTEKGEYIGGEYLDRLVSYMKQGGTGTSLQGKERIDLPGLARERRHQAAKRRVRN